MTINDLKKSLECCPFCGESNFSIDMSSGGKICNEYASSASIYCSNCCLKMTAYSEAEHYEQIEGDMYRKIPIKYAEEVLLDRWNTRYTNE